MAWEAAAETEGAAFAAALAPTMEGKAGGASSPGAGASNRWPAFWPCFAAEKKVLRALDALLPEGEEQHEVVGETRRHGRVQVGPFVGVQLSSTNKGEIASGGSGTWRKT